LTRLLALAWKNSYSFKTCWQENVCTRKGEERRRGSIRRREERRE